MIAQIDTSGTNLELDDDVVKYIHRKIGRLDRYMPRAVRKSSRAVVTLKVSDNQAGNTYECEVILRLNGERITAKESTLNKFAAVDIVEAKLKNQLRKYKDTYIARKHGLLRRVRERFFAPTAEN